jgi:hypothetical protein
MEKTKQDVLEERPFATEKMRTAGDVEKQPVLAIKRHQRGIAIAPVGHRFQQPQICRRIFLDDIESGTHGTGFCHALTQFQPDLFRHFFERRQPHGILQSSGTDERRRLRTPGRTPGQTPSFAGDPIGLKPGKGESQNTLVSGREGQGAAGRG